MSDDARPDAELAHPLDRLTSGGWWRGLLRLTAGLAVVGVVLWFAGEEAYAPLLDLRMIPFIAAGAAVHLLQRVTRIRKWFFMIADADLVKRTYGSLLRIQLIGMMVNLVLPLSEGMKAWLVSRDRRQLGVAVKSLVADMALHTAFVGISGVVGVLIVADASWVSWAVSLLFALGAPIVMLAIHFFTREQGARVRIVDARVLGWCGLEWAAQLGVYGVAVHAVGLSTSLPALFALASLLYVTDLVMITPQGMGAREAVFAAAVALMPGATATTGVTMGLVISAMLLTASILGGTVGLLLPDPEPDATAARE